MGQKGLLYKVKLHIIIIFVICLQSVGSYTIDSTPAKAVGLEPKVSISSPETGSILKQKAITLSGSYENFGEGVTIVLYNGSEVIGSTKETFDNTWTLTIDLMEGNHRVYAKATDSNGVTADSSPVNILIDTISPVVSFVKPLSGAYLNSGIIEGVTEPSAAVHLCMDCNINSDGQLTGAWVSVNADNTGNWMYEYVQLAESSHTLYARASDLAGNEGLTNSVTFTLDKSRPIVLSDVIPKPDMTQVSLDTSIKVIILESSPIDLRLINKSITLTTDGGNVSGKIEYNNETKELTIVPSEPLLPGKKYYVAISPLGIIDSAGNAAFPRFWSFMTKSIPSDQHENPHGSYGSNVNTCANCHSTHTASSPTLLNQTGVIEPPETKSLSADNYCMACHDGTVVPAPQNMGSTHTHDAAVKIDGTPSGSSCASCHNPHLDWSDENPNLIQDHITYMHLPPDPKKADENKPTEEVSSKEQLCESCHESDSAQKIAESTVKYRIFQYKKASTAVGIYEDFDLCLRCHNPNFKKKYEKTPDIASYYNNVTEEIMKQFEEVNGPTSFSNRMISAEEKNFSGHIIKAQDGSPLAGHIPCAECHDTHGSNNIKQLKTQIGHENPKNFEAKTGEWDAAKERDFCIKCHNGETAIYGVIGTALKKTVIGHEDSNQRACSSCHGGSGSDEEKARRAAHAPIRPAQ